MNSQILNSYGVMPMIPQEQDKNISTIDIFSRLLLDRIIFIGDDITQDVANVVHAQLLYLNTLNQKEPIYLYINSYGGSVDAGMMIFDTMNFIEAPVYTVCTGVAMSMAAFLLAAGEPGHRSALPNARIMIHQIYVTHLNGDESTITIHANELKRRRRTLEKILAILCNRTEKEIHSACDRDNYMLSTEAMEFGLIDVVKINKEKYIVLKNTDEEEQKPKNTKRKKTTKKSKKG